MRSAVYVHAVEVLGEYDDVLDMFKKSGDASERGRLLAAFAGDASHAADNLAMALDADSAVRLQDVSSLIAGVARAAPAEMMPWFKANYAEIDARLLNGGFNAPRTLKSILSGLKTAAEVNDARDFIATLDLGASEMTAVGNAFELAENRVRFVERHAEAACDGF